MLICNLSRSAPERIPGGGELRHHPCDLSKSEEVHDATRWVLEQAAEAGPGQVLLVNNAGFGAYGHFPDPTVEHQEEMVAVNIAAPVGLTGRLLPLLRERGGAIINICSLAAFQPTPYMSTYGASKAFLLYWSLALQQELKGDPVRVLAVCPGPTKSNFFKRAGFATPPVGRKDGDTSAEDVVEAALQALAQGRALVVPGVKNKIARALLGPLPKTWQARITEIFLRRMRLEKHKDCR